MLNSIVLSVPIYLCCWADQTPKPANVTVEQLFAECHAVAARLKSVDFAFSFEDPMHGKGDMRLRERDGKLRGDRFNGPYVPDAEGEIIHTFDGKTHLMFRTKTKELGKTDKPTEAFLMPFQDPLCLTYRWLMAIPMSWPRAKSQALWLEHASRAELQTPTTVNNVPCQRVRLPLAKGYWQIIEIADGLRIPLKWTEYTPTGLAQQETNIREWREYPSDAGPVVLPTLVESITRYGNGVERAERYTVDLASVRINPALSEDIFTISLGNAAEIYDKDAQEVFVPEKGVIHKVNDDGTLKLNARRIPAKTSRGTWAVIGGLIVAVVAVVAIRLGSRRREQ